MNRRGFLTLCSAMAAVEGSTTAAPPPDPFDAMVHAMNEAWNRFYRKFAGCAPEARDIAECRPARGGIDRHEFGQARKAAKKLFGFAD
jgi:hypothetical protein